MFLFDDGNGKTHRIGSGNDVLKALGQDNRPTIFITDEKGALVGAGVGIEGAQRSQPLIKALRDSQPMAKSFSGTKTTVKAPPKVLFKKSANTSLNDLNKAISDLQKSMSVGISVSDDGATDDDVWSVIADLDTRMSAMEANIKNISDFIVSL
jgi:hypothetical protein